MRSSYADGCEKSDFAEGGSKQILGVIYIEYKKKIRIPFNKQTIF